MASKIKLIASDMDGTLLDENGQVPPETFDLILALRGRGVRFVASSGRRYDRLCDFFSPVKDRMDFVASNGAQVFADGVQIDREVYSHLAIRRLAKTVAMFPNMHLALFDRTKSYLLDDEDKFVREVDKDLPNVERIYELPSPQVSIIKASIFCDDGNVMDNAYVLQRELGGLFTFAPSGSSYIDAMQPGISKASGIAQVMEYHGIDASEVMAFGDAMNDYEIIRFVGTGCAMANGRPALRAVADRVIGSNVEHAVQSEMRRVLESL
ncbi:Cof-like hydrolase [Collinsella intestinalis DSM 13280]|uniref:Cof-like hydrolase n=1 Tax=Collinsella intestinalis DSM 13280 TaxID=521003 RepID=C4F9P8_9ACTN|nr:HAD family hydrolase [Collinsella intestinalis]EEP44426.1 Cof-like hydrolase [Collinsella intestinalis DSM 13280]